MKLLSGLYEDDIDVTGITIQSAHQENAVGIKLRDARTL